MGRILRFVTRSDRQNVMTQEASPFLTLLDVFWVNILLSGDNAILIAVACHNLPDRQRRIGMILGAGTAIGLRLIFSAVAIPLLSVPGLKFIGGILLIWIATALISEADQDEADLVSSHNRLWQAVGAIAMADVILSLDNVLVIVGIAHDAPMFLVVGLLLSVPLIVWGANSIGALIERYPALVFIGAGLIGWSAGQLVYSDPWMPETILGILGGKGEQGASLFATALVLFGGLLRRRWGVRQRGPSGNSLAS